MFVSIALKYDYVQESFTRIKTEEECNNVHEVIDACQLLEKMKRSGQVVLKKETDGKYTTTRVIKLYWAVLSGPTCRCIRGAVKYHLSGLPCYETIETE